MRPKHRRKCWCTGETAEAPIRPGGSCAWYPTVFLLWGYRDRMLDLKNDKRFRYILIFKNHGEAAGATVEHPHSQLIALPIVPRRVREEVDNC